MNHSFTIITVVYNDFKNIELTIKSVLNQSYFDIEYILIDGGSNDGTLDIINLYQNKISYVISEKDNGIYDAMNKGIDLATNDWVIFMNSGDIFNSKMILNDISKYLDTSFSVVYGNFINYKNKVVYPNSLKNIWKGSFVCHQSTIIKIDILKKFKYNTEFKIASDFDLLMMLYSNGYIFKYVDLNISKVSRGGVSDLNRIRCINEFKIISLKYRNNFFTKIYFNYYLLPLNYLKNFTKKFITTIS